MGALRPVVRGRLYEQLVSRITEHIDETGLKVGDRLPSERELADRLQVSRSSVKQAILVLEVQGVLESRHGGGTFLVHRAGAVETIDALLDRRVRLPDILEAREAIEEKAAELAAGRRTDDELLDMANALEDMAREIASDRRGEDADQAFHLAVIAASGNSLLMRFYTQISSDIAESRTESLRQPGRPPQSLSQHQAIYDAISRKDEEGARRAMHVHIQSVRHVRLLTWDPGS